MRTSHTHTYTYTPKIYENTSKRLLQNNYNGYIENHGRRGTRKPLSMEHHAFFCPPQTSSLAESSRTNVTDKTLLLTDLTFKNTATIALH